MDKALKKNPCNVSGFIAGTTFYAFVVWRDKVGNESKPSAPLLVRVKCAAAPRLRALRA